MSQQLRHRAPAASVITVNMELQHLTVRRTDMRDLKGILESLGRLHDSVVCRVCWVPEQGLLELEIEDFFSNLDGLPEYPGCKSGSLVFQKVGNARFDLDMVGKRLNVDELIITSGKPFLGV